ncbi:MULTISPECIES: SDR family NAD(P)-dependent oxidoreductase [Nocardioides]|uniref:SDR family NAD(P)-dependent oxidoreductase n=1 Tax=Nocardioides vastitatis TaxID=2568655 RepID=A0ABW0ZBB1_9ACTN|nr:SDR family NAD(P)-dependent oxidoreductase [Nocardioides sp.]
MSTSEHTTARRTILVTGASRGIGLALVEEALRRGAGRVYAGMRSPVDHPDGRVVPLLLDVTDPAQIETAVKEIDALDVVINNAGLGTYEDLADRAVLENHLAVNLYGPYDVTSAVLPLLARSGGEVVNILSLASLASLPMMPAYSISKAAALSLTQAQRALFAEHGVRVRAVLTGPTDTDMTRSLDIPKTSPRTVARAIFDGLESDQEDIFPDPMSASLEPHWASGVLKTLERANSGLRPAAADFLSYTFEVDQTPEQTFAAINDVRAWWSGELDGPTDTLGSEFTYTVPGIHYTKFRIAQLDPARRIAWQVLESWLSFTADQEEWTGTTITFDITGRQGGTVVTFTHEGLRPDHECYDVCANAWGEYINGSLRDLIATGTGRPSSFEGDEALASAPRPHDGR